jgi:hypothetical protein
MALSDKDKEDIAHLVRTELATKVRTELERLHGVGRPTVIDPSLVDGLVVRRPGSFRPGGGGALKSSDDCCNGCD